MVTRVWCGCVFFTVNPQYNRTPLLIFFGYGDRYGVRRFSLVWDDVEMSCYYDKEKDGCALRFHECAIARPRDCSRAVHETFRMVLKILGKTAPPASVPSGTQHGDMVFAKREACNWQYLHACNGIVKPQARTTEHMHAFLQVLG